MALPSKYRILCVEYTSRKTIFGWIVFLYNVISILISLVLLVEADHLFKAAYNQVPQKQVAHTWISPFFGKGATIYSKFFIKSFLVFRICGLITSISLIGGLVKRKRNLLIPYIVYDFMGLTLWTVIWTSTVIEFFDHMSHINTDIGNIYWIHVHVPELLIKTIGFGELKFEYKIYQKW